MSEIINKSVFQFLNDLSANNNRDWFNEHKAEYKKQQDLVENFFKSVFKSLNTHDRVGDYKMFRIYRDVRFSKDKTPYKSHFSAVFHRLKPEFHGVYYMRIKPNNESFIRCGIYSPEKDELYRIRKEFEADGSEIINLLNKKAFTDVWGNLNGEQLKTAPRGFDASHPNIQFIRKKEFTFNRSYKDTAVLSSDFFEDITESFKKIRPFFNYMSSVLTTNLDGESVL